MMSDSTISTVAAELVGSLMRHGVDTIFGIGGTHTLQLLGAIERSTIRFIPARTELGAAYMAIGYARSTARAAAVLTSTGPGALNVVGVLEDASWSSVPLVHLTTSVGGAQFAGGVHETPRQRDVLQLVSKAVVELDLDAVNESVGAAVRVAHRRPEGPVTIDVKAGNWAAPTLASTATVEEDDDIESVDLRVLRDALAAAERPMLFVGGGAVRGDGGAAAMELAERLGAPVVTSYQGRTAASSSHPLYLGAMATEESVRSLVAEADLGIVLGSKLSALGTAAWQLPLPERTFRIALARGVHGSYPHLRELRADAVSTARALVEGLAPREPWADCAALRGAILDRVRRSHPGEMAFVAALERRSGAEDLFAGDMSKAGFWAMKYMASSARATHAFSSYMAMGSGLPMAIGMAVATGKPVVALIGDGALQMSMAELSTLGELKLPVTVLVIVDHAYGILRDNCAAVGGSRSMGVDLWNPDLNQLARAYGFEVADVDNADELSAVLERNSNVPRMVLVHEEFSRQW